LEEAERNLIIDSEKIIYAKTPVFSNLLTLIRIIVGAMCA